MTSIQHDTNSTRHVTIGTRQSKLALVQTEHVESCLRKLYPNFTFEIIKMATTGDKILDVALSKIGEKSLFTKELEVALENRTVDLVVHSLKDLPTTLPKGMALGAILEREDPNDALVLSKNNPGFTIDTLPAGSVIGTSSVRRISQLKRRFPHLKFIDVRGNLNTRLAKLDAADGPYSALILAVAGLLRLNMSERISQILPRDVSLHAVGQGALGVECRENDLETLNIISKLDHLPTRQRCTAERAMMRTLEGGCSVPIGVNTTLVGDELTLEGAVVSLDGQKYVHHIETAKLTHDLSSAEKLGQTVADKLNAEGAEAILLEIKNSGTAPQLPFGK